MSDRTENRISMLRSAVSDKGPIRRGQSDLYIEARSKLAWIMFGSIKRLSFSYNGKISESDCYKIVSVH